MNHDEKNESKPDQPEGTPATPKRRKGLMSGLLGIAGLLAMGGSLGMRPGGTPVTVPPPPGPKKKRTIKIDLRKLPTGNLAQMVTDFEKGKFDKDMAASEKAKTDIKAFMEKVKAELSTRPGYRRRKS